MGSALRFRLAAALLTVALATACTDGPTRDPTPGQGPASAAQYSTSLDLARAVHRAVVLRDGRVLLTGGCSTAGCEGVDAAARSALFDPRSGLFTDGPAMAEPRVSHTATLLPDGRVLVIGGYPAEGAAPTGSMEVYDPQRNRFLMFGSLQVPRADHTATLLPNGLVLVAGGRGADGRALEQCRTRRPGDRRRAAGSTAPRTENSPYGDGCPWWRAADRWHRHRCRRDEIDRRVCRGRGSLAVRARPVAGKGQTRARPHCRMGAFSLSVAHRRSRAGTGSRIPSSLTRWPAALCRARG